MCPSLTLALDATTELYGEKSLHWLLAGETDNTRKYAQLCIDIKPAEDAFYLGYAHEAMVRAEFMSGSKKEAQSHLSKIR